MSPPRYATLLDYLAVIRRRKWTVLIVLVASVAASYLVSTREHKVYSASSQVLVSTSIGQITGAQQSNDVQARIVANLAEVAHTDTVAKLAATAAGLPGVGSTAALNDTSVAPATTNNILTFSVRSKSPAVAKALVNAYAAAFVKYETGVSTAGLTKTLSKLQTEKASLEAQAVRLHNAGQSVSTVNAQLNKLVGKITNLQSLIATQESNPGTTVSTAATGARQVQPNVPQNLILGLVLGCVIGVIAAFLREALDTRVRSTSEIGGTLGIQLLARIPAPSKALRVARTIAMVDGDAAESEPYRKLRVGFDFSNLKVKAATVMVTSAVEQEGKSTTSANLAYALALSERRVILVDLDLRRPYVSSFFKVATSPGATDVLMGSVSLDDALVEVPVAGSQGTLTLLPAGAMPPNPAELMESDRMRELLSELSGRADVVVVDSAPLLPVVDSVALSRLVGGVIPVIHLKNTARDTLEELHRVLGTLGSPVLGYVLAGVGAGSDGYGYGSYGYSPGAERASMNGEAAVEANGRGSTQQGSTTPQSS
jgi:succinoglycan biosynthesis transport protein ExoP